MDLWSRDRRKDWTHESSAGTVVPGTVLLTNSARRPDSSIFIESGTAAGQIRAGGDMIGKSVGSIVSNKHIQELIAVPASATVSEAVAAMSQKGVGAILIRNRGDTVDGIFTERDLMTRVVNAGRDPKSTPDRHGHEPAGAAGGRLHEYRGCAQPDGRSRSSPLAGRGPRERSRVSFRSVISWPRWCSPMRRLRTRDAWGSRLPVPRRRFASSRT